MGLRHVGTLLLVTVALPLAGCENMSSGQKGAVTGAALGSAMGR